MIKKISLLFLIAISLASCASKEKIVYFNGINSDQNLETAQSNFETKIKPDDALMIMVTAPDLRSAEPFNLPFAAVMGTTTGLTLDNVNVQPRYQTYLVDRNGKIEFPVLGTLSVGGFTKEQVITDLNKRLEKYINTPIVNVRIVNYKISVIGEVIRPNSYVIQSERISVPEALALAGDLTIYGERSDILLIRDLNGVKTHYSIDLTKSDFINSPYYYLQQNDVLYVKPNKTKINSSVVGPNTTVIISTISLLITAIAIILR
ncbi:polysaccharide biosynthesis/export family protein [Flavobacterium psychrotrophum]|uniref:polysaccharide biosynthesis/export family protein n=1 Tax=Flavobacterium psychrotrophum TaxID=2294119 RepID=UPI000E31508D|nr:polysaccharide biosynthesis/export family protein [Flavobacterium psychrotrophum]